MDSQRIEYSKYIVDVLCNSKLSFNNPPSNEGFSFVFENFVYYINKPDF